MDGARSRAVGVLEVVQTVREMAVAAVIATIAGFLQVTAAPEPPVQQDTRTLSSSLIFVRLWQCLESAVHADWDAVARAQLDGEPCQCGISC